MNSTSGLPASVPPSEKPTKRPILWWPATQLGWWALALTAVTVASLFILPMITMAYRTTYPIVDTWVMPAALAVLVVVTAVLSMLAIWRAREALCPEYSDARIEPTGDLIGHNDFHRIVACLMGWEKSLLHFFRKSARMV